MSLFGEWQHIKQVTKWEANHQVSWKVDVLEPGYYQTKLNYTDDGKLVWKIECNSGYMVQNQQSASSVYTWYPMGWMKFDKPGKYTLSVSLVEGEKASLTEL